MQAAFFLYFTQCYIEVDILDFWYENSVRNNHIVVSSNYAVANS